MIVTAHINIIVSTPFSFIRYDFSGLNFLDLMVRQGNIDSPPKPPLIPGFECSGIVESIGENTHGFEVSDNV